MTYLYNGIDVTPLHSPNALLANFFNREIFLINYENESQKTPGRKRRLLMKKIISPENRSASGEQLIFSPAAFSLTPFGKLVFEFPIYPSHSRPKFSSSKLEIIQHSIEEVFDIRAGRTTDGVKIFQNCRRQIAIELSTLMTVSFHGGGGCVGFRGLLQRIPKVSSGSTI